MSLSSPEGCWQVSCILASVLRSHWSVGSVRLQSWWQNQKLVLQKFEQSINWEGDLNSIHITWWSATCGLGDERTHTVWCALQLQQTPSSSNELSCNRQTRVCSSTWEATLLCMLGRSTSFGVKKHWRQQIWRVFTCPSECGTHTWFCGLEIFLAQLDQKCCQQLSMAPESWSKKEPRTSTGANDTGSWGAAGGKPGCSGVFEGGCSFCLWPWSSQKNSTQPVACSKCRESELLRDNLKSTDRKGFVAASRGVPLTGSIHEVQQRAADQANDKLLIVRGSVRFAKKSSEAKCKLKSQNHQRSHSWRLFACCACLTLDSPLTEPDLETVVVAVVVVGISKHRSTSISPMGQHRCVKLRWCPGTPEKQTSKLPHATTRMGSVHNSIVSFHIGRQSRALNTCHYEKRSAACLKHEIVSR